MNQRKLRADQLIPLADAVDLLADRDRRPHDTDRIRKMRMRRRITYDAKTGKIPGHDGGSGGLLRLGYLVAWAQSKWPGRYDDLPASMYEIRGTMVADGPSATIRAKGRLVPIELADCQRQLEEALKRLAVVEEEVDRLRPAAAAWNKSRARNSVSARKLRPRGK